MRRDIDALTDRTFDVAVIGGGMHGAWIALRAVEAGLSVALIERDDFAGATSANSLKILHGGLRYLQHLDFPRMRSSIRARREFARRSPHLFEPLGCLMPLQRTGLRSPPVLRTALFLNDLVSSRRNDGVPASAALPAGRLITAEQCRDAMNPLAATHPVAGALWWDGLALDAARLSLEPLLAAVRAGAVVASRVRAERYLMHAGRVHGIEATDVVGGRSLEIRSRVVVNATGPWIGALSRQSGLATRGLPPAWTAGMNLVLRRPLGPDTAVTVPFVSDERRRELFFVPWRGVTMVGTHYEPIRSVEEVEEPAPYAVIEAFVAHVARAAPHARVSMDDVALVHWGALPLAKPGELLPAGTPVLRAGAEESGAAGLVLVAAEKLTSAPQLSLRVLKRILVEAGHSPDMQSRGSAADGRDMEYVVSLPIEVQTRLAARYGARWPEVAEQARSVPALLERIAPGCDVLGVEIVHAIRGEMALTLEDLVMRRLGLGDRGDPGRAVLEACMALAATVWPSRQENPGAVDDLIDSFSRNRSGRRGGQGTCS